MRKLHEFETALVALFKKASLEGRYEKAMSASQAISLRAKCYALAKKIRTASEQPDATPDLMDIADMMAGITISVKENVFSMRRKELDDALQLVIADVTDAERAAVDLNAKEMADSSARLLEKLGMRRADDIPVVEDAPAAPNPYASALRHKDGK